jgi:hypothetical protein
MIKNKVSELRKQALKDLKYILKTYGAGASNDYDDMRLMQLLENPCNKEALKILTNYLTEYFDVGYCDHDGQLVSLPEDNNMLREIRERWSL